MFPEEDEYHLLWLKKDDQVLTIFSQTGAMVKADKKEATRHLATHALCKQSMKNRGNAKLLDTRKWQRVKRYRSGPNEQILYDIIREAKYGIRF